MARGTLYDKTKIKRYLHELFEQHGRGAGSELARAVGVSPTSANRWASDFGDCPAPEHWAAIENFFSLAVGTIAEVGGLAGPPPSAPGAALDPEVLGLAALAGELTPEGRAKVEGYIRALLDGDQ